MLTQLRKHAGHLYRRVQSGLVNAVNPTVRGTRRARRQLLLECMEPRKLCATFTVTNLETTGPGSLQQAILSANLTPAADSIQFNIPGAGTKTIVGALPVIRFPLTIDGTSQPGYAENLGRPLIELKGNGIVLEASNSKIAGLAINESTGFGISITGAGKNTIQANYIGTDVTGTVRLGNSRGGIYVAAGANDNVIGTDGNGLNDANEGNLISANGFINRRVPTGGIEIDGAHRNIIAGNLIGTDVSGQHAIANASFGVSVVNGGRLNRIGTNGNGVSDALEGNLITGVMAGIHLADYGTSNNIVAGNSIGVGRTGVNSLGGSIGIELWAGADHNRIGTDANGLSDVLERNTISGNVSAGLDIQSDFNSIAGNYIGTDASGATSVPNGVGIQVSGWTTVIGGVKPAARNVVSGNLNEGIVVTADSTKIQGNYIGVDASGTYALPNASGISVYYGLNLLIGGGTSGAKNVISGNMNNGIELFYLSGPAAIQGNYIGTNASGTQAIGNGTASDFPVGYGIEVFASTELTIGGSTVASRNLISGNVLGGIAIESNSSAIKVVGNYIGINAAGNASIGNLGPGVLLTDLTHDIQIGGTVATARNVISGNEVGIQLVNASNNLIQGNYLGTDKSGKLAVGNLTDGIRFDVSSTNNTVGSPGNLVPILASAANTIAFNGGHGVSIVDASSIGNSIRGNAMFGNVLQGISNPNGIVVPPVLSRVRYGASTLFEGFYRGIPNTSYVLDFYATPSSTFENQVQGKRYLTSIVVTTDASGMALFSVAMGVRTSLSEWITAIATDSNGTSSECSLAIHTTR